MSSLLCGIYPPPVSDVQSRPLCLPCQRAQKRPAVVKALLVLGAMRSAILALCYLLARGDCVTREEKVEV